MAMGIGMGIFGFVLRFNLTLRVMQQLPLLSMLPQLLLLPTHTSNPPPLVDTLWLLPFILAVVVVVGQTNDEAFAVARWGRTFVLLHCL